MNYKNINADELNYILYCRKSSDSEDKQVQSLETQIRELEEHAKKNGLKIVKVIQESKSAFKTGREGFGEMLDMIQKGKANALLVVRANRISRNGIDAGQIIDLLDTKKLLYIRCPSSTCYTTSSTDKMMIALELIFSKKDSDDKSDMVKEGIKTKAFKGIPNGQAKIGYKNNLTNEKGDRNWDNDLDKQMLLKNMFTEFLKGTYSANSLARYAMENLKITTTKHKKIGGKIVKCSHVYTMLKDPVYAGFFYSSGARYELDQRLNRIITEEEHYKILNMLGERSVPAPSKHESLYSGLVLSPLGEFVGMDLKRQMICDCKHKFAYRNKDKCPKCDIEISKMIGPKYLEYKYYYNVSKRNQKQKVKSIEENEINKTVVKEILEPLSLCPELTDWCKKYIHESQDKEIIENQNLINLKHSIDKDIEIQKSKAREFVMSGTFSQQDYKKEIETIEAKAIQIKNKVSTVDFLEKLSEMVDVGVEGNKIFDSNLSIKIKKELLIKSRSNLIWNEKELSVVRSKWLEAYIQGIKTVRVDMNKIEPKNNVYIQSLNGKSGVNNRNYSRWLPGLGSNQD